MPRVECWNCGKKWHLKKDCWVQKKKKQDNNNKKNEASTNFASDVVKDASILALYQKLESWVLDSSASFYLYTKMFLMYFIYDLTCLLYYFMLHCYVSSDDYLLNVLCIDWPYIISFCTILIESIKLTQIDNPTNWAWWTQST